MKTLTIEDGCPDQDFGQMRMMNQLFGKQTVFRRRFAEDSFLCGVICGSSLRRALKSLPVLHSVTIRTWKRVVHGLSWDTVKMISSLPHVREVSIVGLLLCPSMLSGDDYRCDSFSSLTSFHYEVPSHRFTSIGTRQTYPFPSEEEALRLVLDRLHSSLEKLVLSSEPAPMLTMSEWQWPHLRELRLCGEWNPNPPVSYLSLLAAMPNLRVLILELVLVTGELDHTHPLWPPGLDMSFPLPYLSRLSVSHPHAKDELYSRLPPSVQELSLCCYPHKSEKAWIGIQPIYTVQAYEYPLLTSTDLRGLLETCHLPCLTRLDIEYQADGLELDLLRSIAVLFPRLSWLQVHRYRLREVSENDDELVWLEEIAQALGQLSALRTICAYLDFPDVPRIYFSFMGIVRTGGQEDVANFTKTLSKAAHVLARAIPSPETVYLWRPRTFGVIQWTPFEVVRTTDGSKADLEIKCPTDEDGPLYPVVPIIPQYEVDP